MEYKIRQLDWFKRREPTKIPQPVKVEIENIEYEKNTYCDMTVEIDDGVVCEFNGRVQHNDIKDIWTVHGFSSDSGRQCFVEIVQ